MEIIANITRYIEKFNMWEQIYANQIVVKSVYSVCQLLNSPKQVRNSLVSENAKTLDVEEMRIGLYDLCIND